MAAAVADEAGHVVVGPAAGAALVGPLPAVHQHVLHQVGRLLEGLLADPAREAALHEVLQAAEVALLFFAPRVGGRRWGRGGSGCRRPPSFEAPEEVLMAGQVHDAPLRGAEGAS